MEAVAIQSGVMKILYKLPLESVLEVDIWLNRDEDASSVLLENFTQEGIPKIVTKDIESVCSFLIKKEQRSYTNWHESFSSEISLSKPLLTKITNVWLKQKVFKNYLELSIVNDKHLFKNWQKLVILKSYMTLSDISAELQKNLLDFKEDVVLRESALRNKQEKEMEIANTENKALELTVNKHMEEIEKLYVFQKEGNLNLLEDNKARFHNYLETKFGEFFNQLTHSQIVYNNKNKLVQLKCGLQPTHRLDQTRDNVILSKKISVGSFNRLKLNITVVKTVESLRKPGRVNQTKGVDETTKLHEIYRNDSHFGERIIGLFNMFYFDDFDKTFKYLINQNEMMVLTENFHEHFTKAVSRLQNLSKRNVLPKQYDIITTKHSSAEFDYIFHIFSKNFTKASFTQSLYKFIFFTNNFQTSGVVFQIERISQHLHNSVVLNSKQIFEVLKCIVNTLKEALLLISQKNIKINISDVYFTIGNVDSSTQEELQNFIATEYY